MVYKVRLNKNKEMWLGVHWSYILGINEYFTYSFLYAYKFKTMNDALDAVTDCKKKHKKKFFSYEVIGIENETSYFKKYCC